MIGVGKEEEEEDEEGVEEEERHIYEQYIKCKNCRYFTNIVKNYSGTSGTWYLCDYSRTLAFTDSGRGCNPELVLCMLLQALGFKASVLTG